MTTHRFTARTAAAAAMTAGAALVLAACGGGNDHHKGSSSSPSAKGKHNAADVTFAKGMIPHHRQAVEMAELAASRASSPKVKKLSADIEKAQGPEIKKMSGWLKSWGEQVPPKDSGMEGMDHHGQHHMPGMMSSKDMDKLKKLSGKEFDTAFLNMMVAHHKGAVSMAGTERQKGAYKPAKDMAKDIADSQTAEITQMNTLLGKR
ncbi:DUF305 domain-containing protein [Streptomyces sp. CA-250714]|uniref:DUF305 domain-containing protein n=1 Tax=Streptomyces sp. CA-250714 TaxID=3240060 RepID=UPI003D8A9602